MHPAIKVVIKHDDFGYDIFNHLFEVRSAKHERTKVAKRSLGESDPLRNDRDRSSRLYTNWLNNVDSRIISPSICLKEEAEYFYK